MSWLLSQTFPWVSEVIKYLFVTQLVGIPPYLIESSKLYIFILVVNHLHVIYVISLRGCSSLESHIQLLFAWSTRLLQHFNPKIWYWCDVNVLHAMKLGSKYLFTWKIQIICKCWLNIHWCWETSTSSLENSDHMQILIWIFIDMVGHKYQFT